MIAGSVITGFSVVSSMGIGAEAFRAALGRRENGFRPLRVFQSPEYRRDLAAEVPDFDPTPLLGKKGLKSCDRSTLLLLASTELLLRDMAILDRDRRRAVVAEEEIGIAVGTVGSMKSIADFDLETIRAPQFVMPTLFPNTVFCAAASYAAIRHGFKESCVTFTADETAAIDAFGAGLGRLAQGRAQHMVVGATHELSAIWALSYQKACDHLAAEAPILGEGACAFSIERRDRAERREAKVLAEVLGCASAFCPDKERAFANVLRRLSAQAGESAVGDVRHVFTAQKADLDEKSALGGSAEVHRLYPAVGYLSALTGGIATAAALADDRIPAGSTVLVSTADPAGACAALLLRKCV